VVNSKFHVSKVLHGPVIGEELRKWPLMHGTLQTQQELEDIRRSGLIATKPKVNSFDYDYELGRINFVFLAPASFRLNYGFGCGSVLVDSAILQRKDLRFSDRDLGEAVDCLKILAQGHGYCGAARETDTLLHLLEQEKSTLPDFCPEDVVKQVIRSQKFKDYCSKNYDLTETEFFKSVEAQAKSFSLSLERYFVRGGTWRLQEEILVPRTIEPEFLLGYWDGRCWVEWRKATDPHARDRVEVWLQAAHDWHAG
jgi:hypothetical protein